jgi:hypothetical protein
MKLEWILLAEGIGQDARGAITMIGLNQNVLVAPALPALTKRALMAHLVDDDQPLKEGDVINFKLKAVSPTDEVISVQSGQGVIAPTIWPDLPHMLDFPMEMILNCQEYGTYRIEFEMKFPDGKTSQETVSLYVRQPPSLEGMGTGA